MGGLVHQVYKEKEDLLALLVPLDILDLKVVLDQQVQEEKKARLALMELLVNLEPWDGQVHLDQWVNVVKQERWVLQARQVVLVNKVQLDRPGHVEKEDSAVNQDFEENLVTKDLVVQLGQQEKRVYQASGVRMVDPVKWDLLAFLERQG